jgi:signal transduction histidine kinase
VKARRALWAVFAIAVGVVAGAMSWITNDLLAFECAQREARSEAAHQEAMRLALWRMDSWLGPAMAPDAETWMMTDGSRMIRAVYTMGPEGEVRAVRSGDADAEAVARAVDTERAQRELDANRELVRDLLCNVDNRVVAAGGANANEYASRAKAQIAIQSANYTRSPPSERSRPLVPLWVARDGHEPELVFVCNSPYYSKVTGAHEITLIPTRFIVYVADWPVMRHGLLEQIGADLPGATLRPASGDLKEAGRGFVLASAPIALDAPRPRPERITGLTPTRGTLVVAWSSLTFAFVAVGIALRRIVDLSDRRSRFASSVTHELRTPLTTFRLYSEMLADGMVTDEAQRQTYLDTLQSESSRLATLVENVLAYARVEEGRMPVRRERIAVADLLLRAQPPLERRASDASMTLSVTAGDAGAAVVDVDPAVVGQILFNLVDNACKYARDAAQRTIELTASAKDGVVALRVRDHGPGLAPDRGRAAFTPFERAGRPAGDAVPGIGLGLALSRALARDLGGDLDLERSDGGASFVLTLPIAARA